MGILGRLRRQPSNVPIHSIAYPTARAQHSPTVFPCILFRPYWFVFHICMEGDGRMLEKPKCATGWCTFCLLSARPLFASVNPAQKDSQKDGLCAGSDVMLCHAEDQLLGGKDLEPSMQFRGSSQTSKLEEHALNHNVPSNTG